MPYSYRSSRTSYKNRTNQNRRSSGNRRKTGSNIDPRRFVAAATASELEPYVPRHAFADFALHQTLQANLRWKPATGMTYLSFTTQFFRVKWM